MSVPGDADLSDGDVEPSRIAQTKVTTRVTPPCLSAPGSFAHIASRLSNNVVQIVTPVTNGDRPRPVGPAAALPLTFSEASTLSGASGTNEEVEEPYFALGSGFLLASDDLIVTTPRVIENQAQLLVRFNDGQVLSATIRGIDPDAGVALLRLESAWSQAIALEDGATPNPGEWIAVLSSPFGQETTVTSGVVRFSRSLLAESNSRSASMNILGVDATIDEANFGGLVVDAGGRLVGLAIAAPRAGSRVGLVLPSHRLRRSVDQLSRHGHPIRTWLGLWVRPIDAEHASELGVDPPRGLLVSRVAPTGPAQEAGIEPDDVITEFAGEPLSTPSDLSTLASSATADRPLPLQIIRDGRTRTLRIRPAPMPQ